MPPVVAGAGPAEFAVEVGVQEELGDRQPSARGPDLRRSLAEVERRERGDRTQLAVTGRQLPDQLENLGVTLIPIAERADGRLPDPVSLVGGGGDPQDRAPRHRPRHQTHCLDQPGPRIRCFLGQ